MKAVLTSLVLFAVSYKSFSYTIGSTQRQGCAHIHWPRQSWHRSTSPFADGVNVTRIKEGLKDELGDNSKAIFATRCGSVIYSSGSIDESFSVYSIGKTVVTTLAGILLQKNLTAIDQPLDYSNNPPLAEKVLHVDSQWGFSGGYVGGKLRSLHSFLSMTSGFGLFPDPGFDGSTRGVTQTIAAYSNNAIEFLWGYVRQALFDSATNVSLPNVPHDQAVRWLFNEHLNGHQDQIHLRPNRQIGGYRGGLDLSARDLSRLGLLYLNGGRFQDKVVLSREYVDNATVVQVPMNTKSYLNGTDKRWNIPKLSVALPLGHQPSKVMPGDLGYGYGLWILEGNEGAPKTFHMSGTGGNYVIVDVPSGMVITILNYNQTYHPFAVDYLRIFRQAIISPALKDGKMMS